MCSGYAFLGALYRAGGRWQVGFNGANWLSRKVVCYPVGEELRKRDDGKQFLGTHGEGRRRFKKIW
jgi:hypothetical protein